MGDGGVEPPGDGGGGGKEEGEEVGSSWPDPMASVLKSDKSSEPGRERVTPTKASPRRSNCSYLWMLKRLTACTVTVWVESCRFMGGGCRSNSLV